MKKLGNSLGILTLSALLSISIPVVAQTNDNTTTTTTARDNDHDDSGKWGLAGLLGLLGLLGLRKKEVDHRSTTDTGRTNVNR